LKTYFIRKVAEKQSRKVFYNKNLCARIMDIFFQDPSDVPLPPEEVRIRSFRAELWPDKRRVRINLEITPFQKKPNGEVTINDQDGNEVAAFSIIETITPRMDFTVHLRGEQTSGRFTVAAVLYYYEEDEQTSGEDGEEEPRKLPTEIRIVDQAETTFEIADR
jgi:hypothetical protein